jgi:hypothetical protein
VRQAAVAVTATSNVALAFYEDLPYAAELTARDLRATVQSISHRLQPVSLDISPVLNRKRDILRIYASQIGERELDLVAHHARCSGDGRAVERIWGALSVNTRPR